MAECAYNLGQYLLWICKLTFYRNLFILGRKQLPCRQDRNNKYSQCPGREDRTDTFTFLTYHQLICYWCKRKHIIKCWTLLVSSKAMTWICILQLYQCNWRTYSITEMVLKAVAFLSLPPWSLESKELQLREMLQLPWRSMIWSPWMQNLCLCIFLCSVWYFHGTQCHEILV